jgi:hypothetical protein
LKIKLKRWQGSNETSDRLKRARCLTIRGLNSRTNGGTGYVTHSCIAAA